MIKYIDYLKKIFANANQGKISITLPNNQELNFTGEQAGPRCDLQINQWEAIKLVINRGDIGFGEAYHLGLIDSTNLTDLLIYLSLNIKNIYNQGNANFLNKLKFYLYNNFIRINTKYGSKKNILAHYDIGNNFYKLWLDQTMTYSSALRANQQQNLEQAQINKYQRIINTIDLSDQRILEIGCGWGGFIEQISNLATDITGITISEQQYQYATQRLANQAKILLQDYRLINNKFDRIVSIEMFEAVGEKYWLLYFNKIKNNLAKKGKALIQTITICEDAFDNYRKSSDYIRHYVFPGGMLPTKNNFLANILKAKLEVLDVFEFGKDYAWTLREWLGNFKLHRNIMLDLSYSTVFLRAWEFYLSMSIAGFETGRTNVMQVAIGH